MNKWPLNPCLKRSRDSGGFYHMNDIKGRETMELNRGYPMRYEIPVNVVFIDLPCSSRSHQKGNSLTIAPMYINCFSSKLVYMYM